MNNNKTPSYSILIPTLNEEKYIGNILSCLVNQTYKDFEVIVVDANSEDKTGEKVLEFKNDLNIRFEVSPERGVSFQRNYAASIASSENLLFFDADVTLEDRFIEKVDFYVNGHEVDVLTSWNVPISDKFRDKFMYFVFNQMYMEPLKNKAPIAVGTFIFSKKEVFNAVEGFQKNINLAEDFDFVRRAYLAGYKYALLKDPKIGVSVRRLDKEGRVNFVWKQLRAGFIYYSKGVEGIQGKFKHEFGKHL